MNWVRKIISKALMTKILHISWGYDKGFYGIHSLFMKNNNYLINNNKNIKN